MTPRGIQTWSQRVAEQIEAAFDDLTGQVAAIAAAQAAAAAAAAAASAAQTTANTANTNAATAQSTANTANTTAQAVKKTDKLSASWTSPGAVLSALDAGSNTTITVASHVRKYGDGTQLSVAGANLTGRAYGTTFYVYYTDATLADTTPTYQTTTDPNVAAYNSATGRHFVGKVTTPTSGGAATTGGTIPPGGNYSPTDVP